MFAGLSDRPHVDLTEGDASLRVGGLFFDVACALCSITGVSVEGMMRFCLILVVSF